MLNIKSEIEKLSNSLEAVVGAQDVAERLSERYAYFEDAISEAADSETSIYYSDIARFISEHVDEVSETIEEFGWDGCGSDLYKAGQMAEYRQLESRMYESEDAIKQLACLIALDDAGLKEIEGQALEEVFAEAESWSEFNAPEAVENYVKEHIAA